jgi:hypothetical protein
MRTASAHKGIIHTIRHRLAAWLHEETETPWQRFRAWGYESPEPAQPVPAPTDMRVSIIDGIAGGPPIEWPIGTYSAVATGRLPHIRRETAIAVQPSSVHLIALPPTPPVDRATLFALAESECAPDMSEGDDLAPTVARVNPALYELQQRLRFNKQKDDERDQSA